ncbi:MAG: hypothetical protein ACQEQF_00255 [Bacillota bacterium]
MLTTRRITELVNAVLFDLNGRREFSEIKSAVEAISFDNNLSIKEENVLMSKVISTLAEME